MEVEDTPFFVTALLPEGEGAYRLRLDDGTSEILDAATLRKDGRGFLARVREGAFPARFTRQAYLDLAHVLVEDEGGQIVLPGKDGADAVIPAE